MWDKLKKKLNKEENDSEKKHLYQSSRPMDFEILDANIELDVLEAKAHRQLRREANAVIESQKKDKRAIERLKNTYYALHMIETAKERMQDIGSSYELNELLKNLSQALKCVNTLEGKTDDVNTFLLRWRERKMNKNVEATQQGNAREYFSKPIEDIMTEDELDKLLNRYRDNEAENEASSFIKEAGRAVEEGVDGTGLSSSEILASVSDKMS